MEVEAGKATYKEFIHTDFVSAVNLGKKSVYMLHWLQVTIAYIGRKTAYKVLAKSY